MVMRETAAIGLTDADRTRMGNAVAEDDNAASDHIVAETADRIFSDLAASQAINHDKSGSWKAPLW